MNWKTLLAALALCLPTVSSQYDNNADDKQVFGIEFTLDHLIASVSLENGSTYALAKVPGDHAYQSLMRNYLSTCHQAHLTQRPPATQDWQEEEWHQARDRERSWRKQYLIDPQRSWLEWFAVVFLKKPLHSPGYLDGDAFVGDLDVEVLAKAVETLKNATVQEMSRRLNIAEPSPWSYASIIYPDFFFTHIRPKPPSELEGTDPLWDPFYNEANFWLLNILRKFPVALYRNKYRMEAEKDDWSIATSSENIKYLRLSAYETLQHTWKFHCVKKQPSQTNTNDPMCGRQTMSPMAIVIEYDSTSFSLWHHGSKAGWVSWNTFPELGAHAMTNLDPHGSSNEVELLRDHLGPAVERLCTVLSSATPSENQSVDLILKGESWTERSMAAFQNLVSDNDEVKVLNWSINYVRQPDIFAASKRVARWGRFNVDLGHDCLLIDEGYEPQWDVLTGHDEL